MISDKLKKAREYEEREEQMVPQEVRPTYHFSPRVGWLNDPNGFSFYGGKYHLFYQYHPYDSMWGPMHWGHAVSSDLIHWEYLPCALAPDQPYDDKGCFSGSAITTPDGRHMLIYTGCSDDKADEKGRWKQVQCIAYGNGTDYDKYEGNPVITSDDLPEGGSVHEFRDPYIFSCGSGRYRAVAANANKDNDGITQICLYKSEDGKHWRRESILFEDTRKIGIMWECPSFFKLGNDYILIASPMDMEAEEADGSVRFPKGNNVCYIIGHFDDAAGMFIPHKYTDGEPSYHPVDSGLDFYAPQVMTTPDGRVIMIGWMQDPENAQKHDPSMKIFGEMTVPRELFIRQNRLCQRPVREISSLRKDRIEYSSVTIDNEKADLSGISGRSVELFVKVRSESDDTSTDKESITYNDFRLRFADNDKYYTEFSFDPLNSIVAIDRNHSVDKLNIVGSRTMKVRDRNGSINLRILIDKWSAEIFINEGEQVISTTFYTDPSADGISFRANGKAHMSVTMYNLNK